MIRCDETPHRTTSRRERRVTWRFAPSSVRPIGRIQRFLLIQLKPKHVSRTLGAVRAVRRAVFRDTLRDMVRSTETEYQSRRCVLRRIQPGRDECFNVYFHSWTCE